MTFEYDWKCMMSCHYQKGLKMSGHTAFTQGKENIQYLLSLRQLPLFFYHCTYHCDVLTHFDHGRK